MERQQKATSITDTGMMKMTKGGMNIVLLQRELYRLPRHPGKSHSIGSRKTYQHSLLDLQARVWHAVLFYTTLLWCRFRLATDRVDDLIRRIWAAASLEVQHAVGSGSHLESLSQEADIGITSGMFPSDCCSLGSIGFCHRRVDFHSLSF